jgi:hypothetical protein
MTATATIAPVTIPRSEIARGLKALASIQAKAVHLDLTGERATISGFTSEVAVRVTLDAEGAPSGAGSVPRTLFAGVMPFLDHDVRLCFHGDHLEVTSGESRFELRTLRPPVVVQEPAKGRRARRAIRHA